MALRGSFDIAPGTDIGVFDFPSKDDAYRAYHVVGLDFDHSDFNLAFGGWRGDAYVVATCDRLNAAIAEIRSAALDRIVATPVAS